MIDRLGAGPGVEHHPFPWTWARRPRLPLRAAIHRRRWHVPRGLLGLIDSFESGLECSSDATDLEWREVQLTGARWRDGDSVVVDADPDRRTVAVPVAAVRRPPARVALLPHARQHAQDWHGSVLVVD